MMRLARLGLFLLAAPVMLSGCATYNMTKPAPVQSQPIAIAISAKVLPAGRTCRSEPIGCPRPT